jgi:hypothetical protein
MEITVALIAFAAVVGSWFVLPARPAVVPQRLVERAASMETIAA